MKLETIIKSFNAVTKVYDSIKDFKRKWELAEKYKELKTANEMFDKQRELLVEKFAEGKEAVSPDKIEALNKEVRKVLNDDIELKHNLRFTIKEVEESKIVGSELATMLDFILEEN